MDEGNLSDALVDFTGGVRTGETGKQANLDITCKVSELVTLENDRKEKLFLEEEARAELFQRVIILFYEISPFLITLEDLGLMTQVSGEMSDHALICCAVRSRRGEVAEQRTELGLVISLRIRNLVKSR